MGVGIFLSLFHHVELIPLGHWKRSLCEKSWVISWLYNVSTEVPAGTFFDSVAILWILKWSPSAKSWSLIFLWLESSQTSKENCWIQICWTWPNSELVWFKVFQITTVEMCWFNFLPSVSKACLSSCLSLLPGCGWGRILLGQLSVLCNTRCSGCCTKRKRTAPGLHTEQPLDCWADTLGLWWCLYWDGKVIFIPFVS